MPKNSNAEEEQQALAAFADQIGELGRGYEQLLQHDCAVLNEVRQSSQSLAGMFMDILASVQFQDITRQQIEQVSQALQTLDSHAGQLAQQLRSSAIDAPCTPLAEHLEALYTHYVMDQQRRDHDRALQGAGGSTAASVSSSQKIELF